MAYQRDLERLARTMHRQRTPPDYIRHYLIEVYQVTDVTVDEVFTALGIPVGEQRKKTMTEKTNDMLGGGTKKKTASGEHGKVDQSKLKRDGFY